MTLHSKLVRDRIPEIIRAAGKSCTARTLEKDAYLAALDGKLHEELDEYLHAHDPEELADLLEVLMACAEGRGIAWETIEALRREKAEKRGGFRGRIWLESVE